MTLYRMAKRRHAADLSGKGAELAGGRWNEIGIPALYLAENISLAILETIVHCHTISDLHHRLLLSIEVPEETIEEIPRDQLPSNWNITPWHNFTINYGSNWLSSNNNSILKIPSAVVPSQSIYLLNPKNRKHNLLKISKEEEFLPDNRLKLSW